MTTEQKTAEEKIEKIEVKVFGETIIVDDLDEAFEFLRHETQGLDEDDDYLPLKITIRKKKMTKSQVESLREFDGF